MTTKAIWYLKRIRKGVLGWLHRSVSSSDFSSGQQIVYKNNSYGTSSSSVLNSLAASPTSHSSGETSEKLEEATGHQALPFPRATFSRLLQWLVQSEISNWGKYFCFNSEPRWVWAYEESLQLKRNKSPCLCKMRCSVNTGWPLSRRKFAKKEGCQEAEKEKLMGLV